MVAVPALALSLCAGCLDSWARLPLLHHPDPSLSCNSFLGLSRRERCLDNPKKLLKKARIGVMQKDWIPQELPRVVALPAGGGDAAGWEPALVRPAGSGCGSGLGSPLPFARQLPVACVARPRVGDHQPGTSELGHEL